MKICNARNYIKILFVLFLFSAVVQAQQEEEMIDKIFFDFEQGMKTGNVNLFYSHISPDIYISLRRETSGYFSTNQAYHILRKFLEGKRISNFIINSKTVASASPNARGIIFHDSNGIKSTSHVFFSLKKEYKGWKISQVTID